jgi:hypothetical protein
MISQINKFLRVSHKVWQMADMKSSKAKSYDVPALRVTEQ